MSIESIIIAIVAASPGLIALIGQLRKDAAAARKTGSEREQLEDEITEKVLKRANAEIDKYIIRIQELEVKDQEREKVLQKLRSDISELTDRLNDSQRRISQLEDEVDKRDKEIALLKKKNGDGRNLIKP